MKKNYAPYLFNRQEKTSVIALANFTLNYSMIGGES